MPRLQKRVHRKWREGRGQEQPTESIQHEALSRAHGQTAGPERDPAVQPAAAPASTQNKAGQERQLQGEPDDADGSCPQNLPGSCGSQGSSQSCQESQEGG